MRLWHNAEPLNYHLSFLKDVMWKGGDFGKFWRRNIERPIEALFRPKKFAGTGAGRIANMIWGAVPGAGPALATAYGAQAGRAHGGGTKGMLAGALRGFTLGGAGSIVKGGLAGGMKGLSTATPGIGSKLAGTAKGVWEGMGTGLTGYKESIPGFGKGGMWNKPTPSSEFAGVSAEPGVISQPHPTGAYLSGATPTSLGVPTAEELALTYPGTGAIGPSATAATPASQSIWSSLWSGTKGLGKKVLETGALSMALRLASGAVPTAEPSYEARNMYGDIYANVTGRGGVTPTGRIGTEKLGELAAGEGWTELDQERYEKAAANLDEDLEKKLAEMEKMYAAYNALDSGQYREEVARMMQETSDLKQQMLLEMQARALERQMAAVAQAVNYDVATVNQLFNIAKQVGADEIIRTDLKNQDYEQLRKDLNTLAYASEGGGKVTRDESGNWVDRTGRILSEEVIKALGGLQ